MARISDRWLICFVCVNTKQKKLQINVPTTHVLEPMNPFLFVAYDCCNILQTVAGIQMD